MQLLFFCIFTEEDLLSSDVDDHGKNSIRFIEFNKQPSTTTRCSPIINSATNQLSKYKVRLKLSIQSNCLCLHSTQLGKY